MRSRSVRREEAVSNAAKSLPLAPVADRVAWLRRDPFRRALGPALDSAPGGYRPGDYRGRGDAGLWAFYAAPEAGEAVSLFIFLGSALLLGWVLWGGATERRLLRALAPPLVGASARLWATYPRLAV
jgi:hypothetical protein